MRFSQLASPAFAGLFAFASLACGSSPKENTVTADAGTASAPASTYNPGPTGTDCTSITQTYSVCSHLSTCPGVLIDQTKFPQCGYSVHGDSIDPECLCYGSMCPMGAPATCADMAAMLASTTLDIVCERYSTGDCVDMGSSLCDLCKNNCNGVLSCMQNCGC